MVQYERQTKSEAAKLYHHATASLFYLQAMRWIYQSIASDQGSKARPRAAPRPALSLPKGRGSEFNLAQLICQSIASDCDLLSLYHTRRDERGR
jgi:hypothetical protein